MAVRGGVRGSPGGIEATTTGYKWSTTIPNSMGQTGRTLDCAIPVARETREDIIKPLKRGGETYDALLRRLAEQHGAEA